MQSAFWTRIRERHVRRFPDLHSASSSEHSYRVATKVDLALPNPFLQDLRLEYVAKQCFALYANDDGDRVFK